MPRTKDKVLSIHTTAEVKILLRLAAEREQGSIASMVEVPMLACADQHRLHSAVPSAHWRNHGVAPLNP